MNTGCYYTLNATRYTLYLAARQENCPEAYFEMKSIIANIDKAREAFNKIRAKTNIKNLFPQIMRYTEQEGCIVVAPHPDDEVIGCGGTLHILRQENLKCKVYYMTYEKDSIRGKEALKAADELDINRVEFIGFNDGMIKKDIEKSNVLQNRLLNDQFGTIFLPSLFEVHPDHYYTTIAINKILQKIKKEVMVLCYEVWCPMMNNGINIINWQSYEQKMRSLAHYKSQVEKYKLKELCQIIDKARSLSTKSEHAEAFYYCNQVQLNNLIKRTNRIRKT